MVKNFRTRWLLQMEIFNVKNYHRPYLNSKGATDVYESILFYNFITKCRNNLLEELHVAFRPKKIEV